MEGGPSRVFGISLFVLIGVSALILGVLNAKQGISGPMQISLSGGNANTALSSEEKLKEQDTDGDMVSDYDEIYVYHTSAYIRDSDSDGIADGVEVANGTDPACPEGKTCGTPAPMNTPASKNPADGLPTIDLPNLSVLGNDPTDEEMAIVAAQIRIMLKAEGLTDEVLDAIDDRTLIEMYNESAAEISNANSNIPN